MREYRDPVLEQERLLFEAHKKAESTIADARIDMHLFAYLYKQGAVDGYLAVV